MHPWNIEWLNKRRPSTTWLSNLSSGRLICPLRGHLRCPSTSCTPILIKRGCPHSSACKTYHWTETLLIQNLTSSARHISGKTRTFKPRKDVPEGTKQYQLRKYAEATLVRFKMPPPQACAYRQTTPVFACPGFREPSTGGAAPWRRGFERMAGRSWWVRTFHLEKDVIIVNYSPASFVGSSCRFF